MSEAGTPSVRARADQPDVNRLLLWLALRWACVMAAAALLAYLLSKVRGV